MDKQRAKIIWNLTNELHNKVNSLYEALMEDDQKDIKQLSKELTSSLKEITIITTTNEKNI